MKIPFVNDRNGSLEAFVDWWKKDNDGIQQYNNSWRETMERFKEEEYDPAPYVSPEASILREAEDLITGERNGDYGDAVEDFSVTAEYWNTYMRSLGMRVFLTAQDVSLLLTLLKIRRQSTHPKRDNLVDAAGYIALAQKCEEEDNDEMD